MRRGLVRAVAVLGLTLALSVVLGALAPAARAEGPRRTFAAWMNAARAERGAAALARVYVLRRIADRHSAEMARAGRIFHTSNLAGQLRVVSWSAAGENVGAGVELRTLYRAFMNSAPHRANILDRSFRRVGIGLHREDGIIWITLIFVG